MRDVESRASEAKGAPAGQGGGAGKSGVARMIDQFTFGNPKEIVAPTFWLFFAELVNCIPAGIVLVSVYVLGAAFYPPYTVDAGLLAGLAVAACVLLLVQYAVELVSYWFTYVRAYSATAGKRTAYVEKLRAVPLGFFSSKRSGDLISSFADDFANVEYTMCYWLPYPLAIAGLLLICLACMLAFDWRMAVALFALLPASMALAFAAGRAKRSSRTKVLEAKAAAATELSEYLHGMKDLKAYRRTGSGFTSLERAYEGLRAASMRDELLAGNLTTLASSLTRFVVPLVVVTGMFFMLSGSLSLLDYIACAIVATKLATPMMMLATSLSALQNMMASGERIDAVMKTPSQVGERLAGVVRGFRFEDASFSYGGEQGRPVVSGVSLTVRPKGLSALVGPSGSGKSTLMRLMARFWDVQGGALTTDRGDDVRELSPAGLLENVSMVMQDAYLFRGSIRENLCFGRDIGQAELEAACKDASCHEFIARLPDGYDTMVGEGGATLSGGERQRLSLARALLKDAPVLLLDEPTASLDADNEALVQQALDRISRDRTVVMIAHRLKTVRGADDVAVVQDGRIVEEGTHDELLAREGAYARLWSLQTEARSLVFR